MKKLLALIFAAMLALSLGVIAFAEEQEPVAQVGDNTYTTLQEAINAAHPDGTVVLLQNIESTDDVTINEELLLNLNGKVLSFAAGKTLKINDPKGIVIAGPGLIKNKNGTAVTVTGSAAKVPNPDFNSQEPEGPGNGPEFFPAFHIVGDVKIEGQVALHLANTNTSDDIGNNDGEIVVEGSGLNGLGENGIALKVTGDGGEIRLEGANLNAGSHGIFCTGDSWINISGATVTGDKTAIEMRAGMVQVFEGPATITANADNYSVTANSDGPTTVGAAIAVVRGDKYRPVGANIFGGKIFGYVAIAQSDPDENGTGYKDDPDADADAVTLDIDGNALISVIKGGTEIVKSEQLTGFIKQGFFRVRETAVGIAPDEKYWAQGTHKEDMGDRYLITTHVHNFNNEMMVRDEHGGHYACGEPGSCPTSNYALVEGSGYHEHSFTGVDGSCINCGIYPVWIYDNYITAANCDDVFGDGKVSYDPKTYTLHLENVDKKPHPGEGMGAYYGIFTNDIGKPITVEYTGKENMILGTHITVWADGDLILKGTTEDAELVLSSDFGGIAAQKKLTVESGCVNIFAVNYGIIANSDFVMKNNAEYYAVIETLDTDENNSALVYFGKADMLGYEVFGSTEQIEGLPNEPAYLYDDDGTKLYVMDTNEPYNSLVKTIYIKYNPTQTPEQPPVVTPSAPSSCDHSFDKDGKCTKCGIAVIDHSGEKPAEEANPNTGAESAVSVMAAVAVLALAGAVISKK